ncbi:hypothetical protein PanWU01x14_028350 [Parasponia andersonii]|uniref:Uncharacterized protein n=1 Tax=Parasponia andersonii TaxID=3476 RepID=A0A2P5DV87_PARAD|nr:hypothetical protein PanWU01x14_028350 [Parasponia andersonii]
MSLKYEKYYKRDHRIFILSKSNPRVASSSLTHKREKKPHCLDKNPTTNFQNITESISKQYQLFEHCLTTQARSQLIKISKVLSLVFLKRILSLFKTRGQVPENFFWHLLLDH